MKAIKISANIESQIAQLDDDERSEYIDSLGLKEPGLNILIKEGYSALDLVTYFTSGPKETRAWTIKKFTLAPESAGKIRLEGKEYEVQDGDVMNFRFNN